MKIKKPNIKKVVTVAKAAQAVAKKVASNPVVSAALKNPALLTAVASAVPGGGAIVAGVQMAQKAQGTIKAVKQVQGAIKQVLPVAKQVQGVVNAVSKNNSLLVDTAPLLNAVTDNFDSKADNKILSKAKVTTRSQTRDIRHSVASNILTQLGL